MNQLDLGNRVPRNASPPNSDCEFLNIRDQYEFAIALSKLAAEDHASVLLDMRRGLCEIHDSEPDSPCPFPGACHFPDRCCYAVRNNLWRSKIWLGRMEFFYGDEPDVIHDFESRTAMALLAAATGLLALEASGQSLQ